MAYSFMGATVVNRFNLQNVNNRIISTFRPPHIAAGALSATLQATGMPERRREGCDARS